MMTLRQRRHTLYPKGPLFPEHGTRREVDAASCLLPDKPHRGPRIWCLFQTLSVECRSWKRSMRARHHGSGPNHRMTDIGSERAGSPGTAFFSYGFRPFFLSAAVFAGLAVPVWIMLFAAGVDGAEGGCRQR